MTTVTGLVAAVSAIPAETWAALGALFTAVGGAIGAVATWFVQRRGTAAQPQEQEGPSREDLQRTLFEAAERMVRLNLEARDAAEADIRALVAEVKTLRHENSELHDKVDRLTRAVQMLEGEARATREEVAELEQYIALLVQTLDALGAPIPPRPRFSRAPAPTAVDEQKATE